MKLMLDNHDEYAITHIDEGALVELVYILETFVESELNAMKVYDEFGPLDPDSEEQVEYDSSEMRVVYCREFLAAIKTPQPEDAPNTAEVKRRLFG